jgi:hypothetical protein
MVLPENDVADEHLAHMVQERSLWYETDPAGMTRALRLDLELSGPLSQGVKSAIHREVSEIAQEELVGIVKVTKAVFQRQAVSLWLSPVPVGTVSLEMMMDALRGFGSPLGAELSGYVIREVARITTQLHQRPEGGRAHGFIRTSAVLLLPDGSVRILGSGQPMLREILFGGINRFAEGLVAELRRRPDDPAVDVLDMGALYYELLSGASYRGQLPGDLPDPRPELVDILRGAIRTVPNFSHAQSFLFSVTRELESGKVSVGSPDMLRRFVREFVPDAPTSLHAAFAAHAAEDGSADVPLGSEHEDEDDNLGVVMSGTSTSDLSFAFADAFDGGAGPKGTPPAASETEPLELEAGDGSGEGSPSRRLVLPKPGHSSPLGPQPVSDEGLRLPFERFVSQGGSKGFDPRRPRSELSAGKTGKPIGWVALAFAIGVVATYLLLDRNASSPPEPVAPSSTESLPAPDRNGRTQRRSPNVIDTDPPLEAPAEHLVSVVSSPSGAEVTLDGEFLGRTPFVTQQRLEPDRTYIFELTLSGHEVWRKTVRFYAGESGISLTARLELSRSAP